MFPGLLLEAFLKGDLQAVLLNRQISDLLAGDGSWAGEEVEADLEGRVSRYLSSGASEEQADR